MILLYLLFLSPAIGHRIFTSTPISIESGDYKFPGNSHGCGQLTTESVDELIVDMSVNSCAGGTIQCPRCFVIHHPIRLSIRSCQSPPRTAKCQETGVCPSMSISEEESRLNEYVFINVGAEPAFVGSDSSDFNNTYPTDSRKSDSIAIPPHSARSGICFQNRFYWP